MHSTSEAPLDVAVTGRLKVNACDSRRSPDEPVSTWMWSMVWHSVVLPGTQTVTVV